MTKGPIDGRALLQNGFIRSNYLNASILHVKILVVVDSHMV